MKFSCSLLLFLLGFCPWVHGQSSSGKIALVIGIQSYARSPLKNSLQDAQDMATALRSLNFELIELYDPRTKKDIKDAVLRYYDLITKRHGTTGLIYYSGHGMQVDGINYLIPTTADPQVKADIDEDCLRLDYLMEVLEQSTNSLNILILDACRNNPFRSFSRSADKGLSMVNAPKGSYIVYATKPGAVASDGNGSNGLFTGKLLKYIQQPNLQLWEVFQKVARDVSSESGDTQRPWIASDYTGDFYFSKNESAGNALAVNDTPKSESNKPIQSVLPKSVAEKVDVSNIRAKAFIYRPKSNNGIAVKCEVFLDSRSLGIIPNKGRIQVNNLKYGIAKFGFKYLGDTKTLSIPIRDNEDIYIRWTNQGPTRIDPESGKRSFEALDNREVVVVE